MTRTTPSIKHYFKVLTPTARNQSVAPRERTKIKRKDIIILSSDEENEAEDISPQFSGLPKLKRTKTLPTMKNVTMRDRDSDSETPSGVSYVTTENAALKRQLSENHENLPDSQEVQPSKKGRSTLNCIVDSDDENVEGNDTGTSDHSSEDEGQETESSQYSSDSSETDDENDFDTDEEDRINSYEEPDPWFIHADRAEKRKKSAKTNGASYDDNQEVSIHKINLNHPDFSRKPVKNIIKFIVDKYNRGRDSSSAETKSSFDEKRVQREPVVKPEDEEHFRGQPFGVKVYVQKVARKMSLLHSYGIQEKATTIHCLIFHHRDHELFAITTNQAWNVVQWCSDFEFPGIIAARLLSKDGELQSTNKGLVGTELTRKTTHKQQKKTNPHDLLTLCTRYTAELRANASILRLSCFQKNSAKNGDEDSRQNGEKEEEDEEGIQSRKSLSTVKGAKVTVSLGNIRILKRLSTSDILSILSILSEISNSKDTFSLDGLIEENSTAHNKYLTTVHTERANELNLCLSRIIHDAIADDNRMAELDNYQLCHKHSSDFFSGHDFELLYKGDLVKEFSEIPTIKQIVVELRRDLGQVAAETSDADFLKRLSNVKLSYQFGTNNNGKKPEKLLNFIDGLLCDSTDNSVFWHVMGMWCHVQDGYINLVHNQFKKMLNDYLLTDRDDPAYLRIPWATNENASPETKLENYLRKFSTLANAWTSEQPERDIVDMIRIGKDSGGKNVFFVYYFLPDLNNQTNVKCNRVAESIMQIGKASMQSQNRNADVAGSEDVKKQLNDVYRSMSQKRQFKSICPTLSRFLQMMAEAKFYLAIGRDVTTTATPIAAPSLANDKEMSKEIASGDIANILENLIDANRDDDLEMLKRTATVLDQQFDKCGGQRLAELIHCRLREHEYLESDGNTIRGKLLSMSRNNFGITVNGSVNQFLYDQIISKFQPRSCTVLSKLGFFVFREEISKLTITSFNLIEIPLQQ